MLMIIKNRYHVIIKVLLMQNKINLIYNQYNLVHYNQSTNIFIYT